MLKVIYIKEEKQVEDSLEEQLIGFIIANPYPEDEAVHKFNDSLGTNIHEMEDEGYKIISTFFCGGKAKEKGFNEEDADPEQLKMGIEVEHEHVDKASSYASIIAKKIALDHLAEDPLYYTHLKEMENRYSEK